MPYHRKTTPQFVEEAQRVHGEKFDYSEVEYVNTHIRINFSSKTKRINDWKVSE